MSFTSKILIGLAAGVATGIFLGEYAAALQPIAEAFVKLLQMTVLPYVTLSIVTSLGSYGGEARIMGIREARDRVARGDGLGFASVPIAFPGQTACYSARRARRRARSIGLHSSRNRSTRWQQRRNRGGVFSVMSSRVIEYREGGPLEVLKRQRGGLPGDARDSSADAYGFRDCGIRGRDPGTSSSTEQIYIVT